MSWRLNEASDSFGDRRAVGSRFQVLGTYAAKPGNVALRRAGISIPASPSTVPGNVFLNNQWRIQGG